MARSSPIKTHGLTHVALAVRDPQRSMRFYQDVSAPSRCTERRLRSGADAGQPRRHRLRTQAASGGEVRRHRAFRIPSAAAEGHSARGGRRAQSGWNDQESAASSSPASRTCSSAIPMATRSRSGTRFRRRSIRSRPSGNGDCGDNGFTRSNGVTETLINSFLRSSVLIRFRSLRSLSTITTATRTPRWRRHRAAPGPLPGNRRPIAPFMPRASPPQPESTATYCLPSTMNVVGGATMPELVTASHSSLPVVASNAWNLGRGAAGEHEPAAVVSIEPQFGDFAYVCVHTRLPVSTFHACTSPTWSAPARNGGPPNCAPAKRLPGRVRHRHAGRASRTSCCWRECRSSASAG